MSEEGAKCLVADNIDFANGVTLQQTVGASTWLRACGTASS